MGFSVDSLKSLYASWRNRQNRGESAPKDVKLHKKIIEGCWKIAEKEGINLRQSYSRTLGQLMIDQRFREHPKRRKKAMAAARKIKTIAGRLVRDVERGLDDKERLEVYNEQLWLYYQVLRQKRDSKHKIYSFHALEVSCISKGKDHKKYEFGNKSGFVITKNSGIILGAMVFEGNPYDGHTLGPQLEQVSDLLGKLPKVALVDRGYKGRKTILGVEIMMPSTGKGKTANEKQRDRARLRQRASIEPVIGHLKSDHRMLRNYLKGVEGDMINTIMAAVAFNMMKRLGQIRDAICFVLDLLTGNWMVKYATVLIY